MFAPYAIFQRNMGRCHLPKVLGIKTATKTPRKSMKVHTGTTLSSLTFSWNIHRRKTSCKASYRDGTTGRSAALAWPLGLNDFKIFQGFGNSGISEGFDLSNKIRFAVDPTLASPNLDPATSLENKWLQARGSTMCHVQIVVPSPYRVPFCAPQKGTVTCPREGHTTFLCTCKDFVPWMFSVDTIWYYSDYQGFWFIVTCRKRHLLITTVDDLAGIVLTIEGHMQPDEAEIELISKPPVGWRGSFQMFIPHFVCSENH